MSQNQLKNKRQVGRFAVVGGVNTLIDFALLFVLKALGLPVIGANLISSTTAFVFSFVANKNYTFKNQDGDVRKQIILFIVVTLTGLWVFQNIIIYLTEPVLASLTNSPDTGLLISKLIATVVSMTWNYVMYALIVFPNKDTDNN